MTEERERDLWPDDILHVEHIKTPENILQEQASILSIKTKNVLKGLVLRGSTVFQKKEFVFLFYLFSPGIDYKYQLFSIHHGIMFYPITINVGTEISEEIRKDKTRFIDVDNEKEFIETLRKIFSAESTKKIVSSILTLSGYGE